jgi:sterol desaturase/sphingolipid hydroxylase (fatty acid hydroxylase superfamily)
MNRSLEFYWFVLFGVILSRYFLVAGGAYLVFYSGLGKIFNQHKLCAKPLHLKSVSNRLIWSDIQLSIHSAAVFASSATIVLSAYDVGLTHLYTDVSAYGLWYLGFSFIAVLILQDTYFYFIHRLLHHPLLFKRLHSGHHQSGDPTPWTSFAFDLPEAVLQALFLIGIVFVIPLHFATLIAVLVTMTAWTVLNHLGFEVFPASFPHHWLGRWFIGSTHHALHHRKYRLHYGLYFTFWDRVLGTHDPNYEHEFDTALRTRIKKEKAPY